MSLKSRPAPLYVMLLRIYDRYIISPSKPQLQHPRNSKTCGRAHSASGFTDVTNSYCYTPGYCFFIRIVRNVKFLLRTYKTTSFMNLHQLDRLQTLNKSGKAQSQLDATHMEFIQCS
jgi:hypothetical protein